MRQPAAERRVTKSYTLFRNKLASRQVRGLVGVSGSQTGGQGVINIAQSELISGSLAGTSWPNNLPASGKQTQFALNVPYRFFGLSESLSWLAQFMGQGFEDVSALANLVLLQEFMMGNLAPCPFKTARIAGKPVSPGQATTWDESPGVTALRTGQPREGAPRGNQQPSGPGGNPDPKVHRPCTRHPARGEDMAGSHVESVRGRRKRPAPPHRGE
jgi:hypothetical protein